MVIRKCLVGDVLPGPQMLDAENPTGPPLLLKDSLGDPLVFHKVQRIITFDANSVRQIV